MLAAGAIQPKSKHTTQPSISGTLASFNPYHQKSKQWIYGLITDVGIYCFAKTYHEKLRL